MSVLEDVVEAAIKIVVDLIHDQLTDEGDQETAMMLAADRLRLRALGQARLNARKKEQNP